MGESTPTWRLYFLGPFKVEVDGRPVPFEAWRSKQALALFKRLAAAPQEGVAREALLDQWWPEESPEKASRRLHTTVYNLRKALEAESGRDGSQLIVYAYGRYRFRPPAGCWFDIDAFENAFYEAQAALRRDPETALCLFNEVLRLYRADFLCEDEYEEWTVTPRRKYRDMLIQALLTAASLHADRQDLATAVRLCRRGVDLDPFREDLQYQYLAFLLAAGRVTEAAQHYRAYTRLLRNELDLEPGAELQRLMRRGAQAAGDVHPAGAQGESSYFVWDGKTLQTVFGLEPKRRRRTGERASLLSLIRSNAFVQASRTDLSTGCPDEMT